MPINSYDYKNFVTCPKLAWLSHYDKNALDLDDIDNDIEKKNKVMGHVKALFLFSPCTFIDGPEAKRKTKEAIALGKTCLSRAVFEVDGFECKIDFLKKDGNAWNIYEVTTKSDHQDRSDYEDRLPSLKFKKYVVEMSGLKVNKVHVILLNSKYIRDEILDVEQLFVVSDITNEVEKEANIDASALKKLFEEVDEPNLDLGTYCSSSKGPCSAFTHCKNLHSIPSHSVFDLKGKMSFDKRIEYYKKGLIDYPSLFNSKEKFNKVATLQIDFEINDKPPYVDKVNLSKFLDKFTYPLYFLDFETMNPIIPLFKGTRPNQQVPTQYSLHYIEKEGGPLLHKEFLAGNWATMLKDIAESLCANIPDDVAVVAYHKSFECTKLKELANLFPNLSAHLLKIADNIVDLEVPFKDRTYYSKELGGRSSIKVVLPALFPNDPDLDYHSLEKVHNGSDAMSLFPKLKDMAPEEREKSREYLLKYCELDTLAMVKIYQKLLEEVK